MRREKALTREFLIYLIYSVSFLDATSLSIRAVCVCVAYKPPRSLLRGATFEFRRRPAQIRAPPAAKRGEEWVRGRFWDQTSLLPGKLAGGETERNPNSNRSSIYIFSGPSPPRTLRAWSKCLSLDVAPTRPPSPPAAKRRVGLKSMWRLAVCSNKPKDPRDKPVGLKSMWRLAVCSNEPKDPRDKPVGLKAVWPFAV